MTVRASDIVVVIHTWLWRVRWVLPIGAIAAMWALAAHPGKASIGGLMVFGGFVSLLAALLWRIGVHPSLQLSARGLRVRRMVGVLEVEWEDVMEVRPGRGGLVVVRRSGEPIATYPIGGKTNLSFGLEIDTYSDRLADWLGKVAATPLPERNSVLQRGLPRRLRWR